MNPRLIIRFFPGYGAGRIDVLFLEMDGSETMVQSFRTSCDDSRVADLNLTIQNLLNAGVSQTVFDFRNMEHCSSAGIVELAKLWHSIEAAGGEVVLLQLNSRLAHVLDVSGMSSRFKVVNALE